MSSPEGIVVELGFKAQPQSVSLILLTIAKILHFVQDDVSVVVWVFLDSKYMAT
ncbi:MAG: hypothetical protein RLQ12_04315 [Cyclobacteriaceae bacterium]